MKGSTSLRGNLLANYFGQVWVALMSVIFVPVYIRYIGIESYGIIGFFAALQSFYSILDMGLSATLNRELALRSANGADDIGDLVRTLEWLYMPFGALIALATWLASDLIAQHWLMPVTISTSTAVEAICLLGLLTAMQWPINFYLAGISGLQRQILLNWLRSGFSTLTAVGAIGVLWLSPTIQMYLWWQIFVCAVQCAVYAWVMWKLLPKMNRPPKFSVAHLKQVHRFAAGLTGLTVLSFMLTQSDRLILSSILSLDVFGQYALAASLAATIYRVSQPMFTAASPKFTQFVASNDLVELTALYHRTSQVMASIILPVALVCAIFAVDLIRLWTGDFSLAKSVGPIFAILIFGSALHGLMCLPYALQLAYGWTRLSFWVNVVSVCFVVPLYWIFGKKFGGVGAASVWLALTVGYITIGVPFMHRRLLRNEMAKWYLVDILPPLMASFLVVLLWRLVVPNVPSGIYGVVAFLSIGSTALIAAVMASPYPRTFLLQRCLVRMRP